MRILYFPLSHPTGQKLISISPGYLVHSSVPSNFLIYLVFWLPSACSHPYRQTLDALNPCYLLLPPTLPEEPPGPEKLLSAPPSSSLGLSKILPAEAEYAEGALQGMCALIWLLIPRKAENTEEHAALRQVTKKEKGNWPGEEICPASTEPTSLNEARPLPGWFSVRNVGFYKIHEMDVLGHINMDILKKKKKNLDLTI